MAPYFVKIGVFRRMLKQNILIDVIGITTSKSDEKLHAAASTKVITAVRPAADCL